MDLLVNNNILTVKVKEYPIVNQLILTGEVKKAYREEIKINKLKKKIIY